MNQAAQSCRELLAMNWRWHGEAAGIAGSINPDHAILIKSNPSRKVFLADGVFLKFERPTSFWRRLASPWRSKAKLEYVAAQKLSGAGIPVVNYLGWGTCGCWNAILSQQLENSENAQEYFLRNYVFCSNNIHGFLQQLLSFLQNYRQQNVYHPDLHLGNLLYQEHLKCFTLVDVFGVYPHTGLHVLSEMQVAGLLLNLRPRVEWSELVSLGAACFVREKVLESAQQQMRWKLRHQHPRRLQQLLNGYPKFSTIQNLDGRTIILLKNRLQQPLCTLETLPPPTLCPEAQAIERISEELYDRIDTGREGGVVAYEPPDKLYIQQ